MKVTLQLADEAATLALGAALAASVRGQGGLIVISLNGPLGAGKTTLARGMIQALGHTGIVKSPTYTLVEPYDTEPPVVHMDLYRLEAPEAFDDLGLEADAGLWLVEWPQRAADFLPAVDMRINLEYDGEARTAVVDANSTAGERFIQCLSGRLESVA